MKRGKTPTLVQKPKLIRFNLDPYGWLVVWDDKNVFGIVHRVSGAVRRLWK